MRIDLRKTNQTNGTSLSNLEPQVPTVTLKNFRDWQRNICGGFESRNGKIYETQCYILGDPNNGSSEITYIDKIESFGSSFAIETEARVLTDKNDVTLPKSLNETKCYVMFIEDGSDHPYEIIIPTNNRTLALALHIEINAKMLDENSVRESLELILKEGTFKGMSISY